MKLGARSKRSSIQSFQDSDRYNFEVGHDHLKLTFSSEEGEMIHYVNHKTAVSYMFGGPIICWCSLSCSSEAIFCRFITFLCTLHVYMDVHLDTESDSSVISPWLIPATY